MKKKAAVRSIAAAALSLLLTASLGAPCAAAGTAGQAAGETQTGQGAAIAQSVQAKSAILVEQTTGKVLYEKNAHEKLPPASITKIMTELLVLEAIEQGRLSFDENITCSRHAASMGGSDIWLKEGEVMSVNDLFKAMTINSANDAAVALAEKVAGSEPAFVRQMNARAKALGMNDTNFVNCTGLDADGHVTSAYDVMLMSRALIRHQKIFDYCTIWMDNLRGGKTNLYNTNKLIRFYQGANGLKTGSTGKAGYCLSATAKRDNMQLIAVTMGSDNSNARFATARALLDYGFAGWSLVSPKPASAGRTVRVLHGQKEQIAAVPASDPTVLVEKGREKDLSQKVSVVSDVMAPVEKGQVLGQITLWVDGKNVGTIPLRAGEAVGRMTFFRAFAVFFTGLVGG